MNVAMIVHAYYLKDARVRQYAELLAGLGHHVDVICLRDGQEATKEDHAGVNIYRVNLKRRRGGKASYIIEYFEAFLRFFFKLNALNLRGTGYDVVHVHNMPNFLVFCAFFQRLFGSKLILDVHDAMPEVFRSKYGIGENHTLTKVLRFEEFLSARFASAIITANHVFRDILISRGNLEDKVSVVMNVPDRAFFRAGGVSEPDRSPNSPFHIIYIGTLAERYGVDISVRAIGKLHREGAIQRMKFTIIPKISDEGQYLDKLIGQIHEQGLDDIFELAKPVPHHQMPDVIRAADLLVYSPLPDIHMDIAISLKIPEMLAVGKPVVASRLSVNLRYFGEEGIFNFEPGNVDECAAQILNVYRHPDRARKAVLAAQAKMRSTINQEIQNENYIRLLNGLLGRDIALAAKS